ncbi:MAG: efflux RND transporter permease subunit [Hyphomicrobiaceae bacterium]
MNISAWSIRQPIPALVLFVVLCALGLFTFKTMSVTRFPNIDVPIIAISVTQSGAAPSELESQVTKRVEDAVASITGVKHLLSSVKDGSSQTVIEFQIGIDTDRALNDVKDAIAKIRGDLPRTVDEPVIQRIDVEGQAIMTFSVVDPSMTLEELSWFVDDTVKRELQGLKGVGRVERYGGVSREIRLALDPDRLMAFGVTAADISHQLRATNADLAGGRSEIGGQEQAIRTLSSAQSLEALGNTEIPLPGGRRVRLSDLGRVLDTAEEPRSFSRVDGEPVVSFAVFRAKGASDVAVAEVVDKKITQLVARHPDVTIKLIDDSVAYTVGNYKAAMTTLLEGAALAVLVVLIFLGDWRATLIAAVALPLSVIPTFWVMDMMGFSLNLVSLLAMTLATGILVDDAIVEIENIVRHMRMGKSAYRASLEAADEIGMAVIAISMTIVAVFAPVSFMGGIAGQYFKQFGLTVAVAVIMSLLVARLITPMMTAYLMRSHPEHVVQGDSWLMRSYTRLLRLTMYWRWSHWLMILPFLAIIFGSAWATRFIPSGLFPVPDEARITIQIELPPGSRLSDTAETTDAMARTISELPEVESVFVLGGAKPTGLAEVRNATAVVRLTPKADRARTQKQIEARVEQLLAGTPDVRIAYVNSRGERGITVSVLGDDTRSLQQGVAKLEAAIRQTAGFSNVSAEAGLDRPEIRVEPKLDEIARLGIAPETIAEVVRVATIGDVGANLAKFKAGDRLIPIRVQLAEAARDDLQQLKAMRIRTANGSAVPLSSVAGVGFGNGPSTIERYDRVRQVKIGADLAPGLELGVALETIKALPAAKSLPPGVRFQESGDAEIMAEIFQGFFMAMGAGMLMVGGLLVLLLRNLFQTITIILSLLLASSGVIVAMVYSQTAFSMPVLIGMLMLMGISTKNAILMVDFAVEEVRQGVKRHHAVIDAGRKRARPIIMTTVAMVAGMVPTALGHGIGGEFRAPMGTAVIGGLIASTVLCLVFVPSIYLMMDDIGRFFGWLLGRFIGPKDEPEAEEIAASPARSQIGHSGHGSGELVPAE